MGRPWLRRSRTRSRCGARAIRPWSCQAERDATLAFGRQTITLMTCGVLIAAGHLSGHAAIGYHAAVWVFHAGALWVWSVDEHGPPKSGIGQVRRPFAPPVP